MRNSDDTARPLRVAVLSWRDSEHPQGGGSELYVESTASGLVARGHDVTILTARHPGSTAEELRDGYRIVRAGGRFTVYLRALLRLLLRRVGSFDVIVDVQNGIPFFARLVTRRPVVVLCHHVHREQWSLVFGGSRLGDAVARLGWLLESRVAPLLLRGCRYITVSQVSKHDLVELGVRAEDISIVYNGTPHPLPGERRAELPEVVVLGRVVPHKRIEHALRAVAALRPQMPGLSLTVIGQGWWEDEVRAEVARLGLEDIVTLAGHVDEARKHQLLSRAWVLATPSVMEGWGLCVVEAASHGTPSVAYRSAGGLAESIVEGRTGLLAEDDQEDFTRQLGRLLSDRELREQLGRLAHRHADHFTGPASVQAFDNVLSATVRGVNVPLSPAVLALHPRPAWDDFLPHAAEVAG